MPLINAATGGHDVLTWLRIVVPITHTDLFFLLDRGLQCLHQLGDGKFIPAGELHETPQCPLSYKPLLQVQ